MLPPKRPELSRPRSSALNESEVLKKAVSRYWWVQVADREKACVIPQRSPRSVDSSLCAPCVTVKSFVPGPLRGGAHGQCRSP